MVDIWILQFNLEPLSIDLESLGVDIESMEVNCNALKSNLSFRNQFGPHDVDVGHMVVDFGLLGVNFGLEVNFKSLGIVFIHLGVGFGPLVEVYFIASGGRFYVSGSPVFASAECLVYLPPFPHPPLSLFPFFPSPLHSSLLSPSPPLFYLFSHLYLHLI